MSGPNPTAAAPAPASSLSTSATLRRLAPYVRHHGWAFAGGFVALVVANWLQLRAARAVGEGTDAMLAPGARTADFLAAGGAIVGLTALLGGFRFAMRLWMIGASRQVERDLRDDLFAKLSDLPPAYYDGQRTGDLMTRATSDVEGVRMFVGPGVLQLFNTGILFPMAAWRLFQLDWKLAAACLAPVAVLPPLMTWAGGIVHRRHREAQERYSEMSAMVQENLAGARVVKAFAREAEQEALFAELNARCVDANLSLARVQSAFIPGLRAVAGTSLALLLGVGGPAVIEGRVGIGVLVEASVVLGALFWPMIALGWTVSLMQRGTASFTRILSILDLPGEEVTRQAAAGARIAGASSAESTADPSEPPPALEFRNLTFRYSPEAPAALSGVSFVLPAGGRLGVTGATGSGKSTLVALAAGLYPAPRGTVFLDGRDVLDIPLPELRTRAATVLQETFLFGDTLAANLAFGAPDADRAAVIDAARRASLHGDVEGFPDGYDTVLGERGINLSGGQKQRAALARALLREPRLLLLDDALSAVDTETEERVLAGLEQAFAGRAAVIVAHRASAVMGCGEILVLDAGRVAERGTHAELLAAGGAYAAMFERQMLSDAVETA